MLRWDDEDDGSSQDSASSDQDYNLTLVEALEKKYLCDEDVDSSLLFVSLNPCKLASEFALTLLVLDHRKVSSIGDVERFNKLAKSVIEVDVSFNRFSDWREIAVLLNLPKLATLNIGFNPLADKINLDLPTANHLNSLYLCGVNLSLSTIGVLLKCMPSLRELYLSENRRIKNGIAAELTNVPISSSVQTLHVIRCCISNWEIVTLLRRLFPFCESLVLCENPLKKTFADERVADLNALKGLRYLSLTGCLIEDWQSIDVLADVDSLRSMKLQHLPLLNGYTDEERFHLIVGRLPYLVELNGSVITEESRITAERFFIRYYDIRDTKPKIFHSLVLRHGHVEQLCHLDFTPKKLVSVVISCEEKGCKTTIKVPRGNSILAFKRTLEKRLNIPVNQMRVFYMGDMTEGYIAEELRFPSCKLSSLRVEDGDHFCIQIKSAVTRRNLPAKKQEAS